MRRGHPFVLLGACCLLVAPCARLSAQSVLDPRERSFWIGATALVAGAALIDTEARDWAARHQSPTLDDAARIVDPLGRARYILPAIGGTYVTMRLAGRRDLSDRVVRIALGYFAADALESALKSAVGRQRPDTTGGAWRFRPFDRRGEFHSFPSAHTVHAFAIAAGVAEEANRPWVSALAYGGATAVAAQRVYRGQHWASDVAASAVLAIAVSKAVNRWMRERDEPAGSAPDRSASQRGRVTVNLLVVPGTVAGELRIRP